MRPVRLFFVQVAIWIAGGTAYWSGLGCPARDVEPMLLMALPAMLFVLFGSLMVRCLAYRAMDSSHDDFRSAMPWCSRCCLVDLLVLLTYAGVVFVGSWADVWRSGNVTMLYGPPVGGLSGSGNQIAIRSVPNPLGALRWLRYDFAP